MQSGDYFGKPVNSEPFDEPSVIVNVVEYFSNYLNAKKTDEIDKDKIILWAKFTQCDYNDPNFNSDNRNVVLLVGRRNGIQIYQLKADDNLYLIFSLQLCTTYTATVLPTPMSNSDTFSEHRPLLVCSCDGQLRFFSIRTGKSIKNISIKDNILQIEATHKIIVASSHTQLLVLCPTRLEVICNIINCVAESEAYSNVAFALSDQWLAFADSHLSREILSIGGDISESNTVPYAVRLLSVKKMVISSLGSGDSVKDVSSEEQTIGVITIIDLSQLLDWRQNSHSIDFDSHSHTNVVVAHFIVSTDFLHQNQIEIKLTNPVKLSKTPYLHLVATLSNENIDVLKKAHLWTRISKIVFDTTGTILLTTCNQGLFCHLFRIAPHPTSSKQSAVLHLYRLKRGDTTCSILSMAISKDGRLASASSNHGTVHIWPISSYGGPLCVRTHCQRHVVNRLSRLERSAGLQEYQITRPHASSGIPFLEGPPNHAFHSFSPRLPPLPIPCTISSYAQLKPLSQIPIIDQPLVLITKFSLREYAFSYEQFIRSESILLFSFDGRLIQYVLHHRPDNHHQTSSRTELDAPFIIEKQPILQWKLHSVDIPNFVDKMAPNRRNDNSISKLNRPNKLNFQSALLSSVIPDFLNPTFPTNPLTPKCWYSRIEISSQIRSTSNIRRQEKFTISTYHTKDLFDARLEVLQKSPSASSDISNQSILSESDRVDISKDCYFSKPVKVPSCEQRIQICNSFCGSSVSDSLGGSIDNMSSILAHAILDDDFVEQPQDIIEEPKTGYIEFMTRDIGQARLRRVSGCFTPENGRVAGLSSSPVEEDILEELDIPESPYSKQSKLSKRHDKKKGRRI